MIAIHDSQKISLKDVIVESKPLTTEKTWKVEIVNRNESKLTIT